MTDCRILSNRGISDWKGSTYEKNLCYGDSNTYGFDSVSGLRYSKSVSWTGRLQQELGDCYEVIEEDCNRRTTVFDDPYELWKNRKRYLPACLNSHKPVDIVVLTLGIDALKTEFHASAQNIGAGKREQAKKVLYYGIMISVSFGVLAAIHFCFSEYFCACGKAIYSFIHNTAAILLVRIPGTYLASVFFPESLFPMGVAAPAGSFLSAIICVVMFYYMEKKINIWVGDGSR